MAKGGPVVMRVWGWAGWRAVSDFVDLREHMSGYAVRVDRSTTLPGTNGEPNTTITIFDSRDRVATVMYVDPRAMNAHDVRSYAVSAGQQMVNGAVLVQGPLCERCQRDDRGGWVFGCLAGDLYESVEHGSDRLVYQL